MKAKGLRQSELPDPLSEENLLRQSGRGLLLIKAFVDEFEMRKAPPLGTEVRLVFHRNEAELNREQEVESVSVKLTTRQVGDVTVIDAVGTDHVGRRIECVSRHDSRSFSERKSKAASEPWRCQLYRQLGHRRDGFRIYERDQSRWPVEAPEPDQARERSAADHEAVHGFRGL